MQMLKEATHALLHLAYAHPDLRGALGGGWGCGGNHPWRRCPISRAGGELRSGLMPPH